MPLYAYSRQQILSFAGSRRPHRQNRRSAREVRSPTPAQNFLFPSSPPPPPPIRRTITRGFTNYRYDAANRLTQQTDPQNLVTTYAYSGMGDRYQRTVGTVTTDYLLDVNSHPIPGAARVDPRPADLVSSPGKTSLASSATTSGPTLYDGLGSVRQMTNATGVVRAMINYDPYGTPFEHYGNSSSTSLGFTGEQTDPMGWSICAAPISRNSAHSSRATRSRACSSASTRATAIAIPRAIPSITPTRAGAASASSAGSTRSSARP